MRVLVVEDDRALGAFLKKGMELEGHAVSWVEDGAAAMVKIEGQCPDLTVLDLSLPKMDGVEVLERMRAMHCDSSVLVLTGRNELDARVSCLNLGADDCLLKPFSFYELTARCRALLRRREQFADPVLRHGDLQLNRTDHKVTRGSRTIELTPKEFALLEYLMVRAGECVSRKALLSEIWQGSAGAGTNVVDVYVNYLRRKLAPTEFQVAEQPLIETVRGAGYRLGGLAAKPVARMTGETVTKVSYA